MNSWIQILENAFGSYKYFIGMHISTVWRTFPLGASTYAPAYLLHKRDIKVKERNSLLIAHYICTNIDIGSSYFLSKIFMLLDIHIVLTTLGANLV